MKTKKEFKIVECRGSPHDIGFQYGISCKQNIIRSINLHMKGLEVLYNASKEQVLCMAKKYLSLTEKFHPDLIEQLQGTAEGAEVSFDEVFALRCMLELGEYYKPVMGLCTSFAATGEATKNEETIIGQNIDWTPNFSIDLLRIKPKKGVESLVLAFGGVAEWSLTSAGLGLAMNLILTPPEVQRINIPCSVVIHKAIQQKNLGDAVGVFAENGRGLLNYVLANSEGDIIDIETTPDDFNILYPERDFIVHSNHYVTERFKKGDHAYTCCPDTYVRLPRLKKLMNEHYGNLSAEVMMELITDHDNYPSSICRHVDEEKPLYLHFETLISIIILPKEKTLYIAYGQPCKYEYVEYKL